MDVGLNNFPILDERLKRWGETVTVLVEMVQGFATRDLNLCLQKLMVAGDMNGGGILKDWKDLPMELLLRILTLVDDQTVIVASGVCTGWREAVSLGLTQLCLSWCKENMNNLVLSIAPKFTKLQTLFLRQNKPQLEDEAVEAIAKHCHDLRDLDLSKSFKLTDRSLYALAHGCNHLTKLNISGCSDFSDNALAYLTSTCRDLKSLNLCGCVRAATDKALQAVGRNCNQLQYLNLGWCEKVSDVGVMSLAYGCPDLRALDLCGCILITDKSVIALADRCHGLRSLGLYYCQNITDRAMYSLASSGRREQQARQDLLFASVFNGNGNGSKYGKGKNEGLRNLNISQCTALTPPAVQAVCDSFPGLHTCPGRHSLIISGCLSLTSVHCACCRQVGPFSPRWPTTITPESFSVQ
ncbi:F-box protein SKP2A isoform X1 [Amborella trichopoda]|uniref:F-box protein SKP2A isoform X1 n=1 Tax=Amborella trichopoda TaxID=13333 RepID=UPI0009BFA6F4|nr:F-box protein SKP2A isoform X1 [Amborella trichopoda]|eukprot:XP_020524556.1 F-box protein SKP2A isoform X1 [Amborella trichopoda]